MAIMRKTTIFSQIAACRKNHFAQKPMKILFLEYEGIVGDSELVL
jgi:hypothetical protein